MLDIKCFHELKLSFLTLLQKLFLPISLLIEMLIGLKTKGKDALGKDVNGSAKISHRKKGIV